MNPPTTPFARGFVKKPWMLHLDTGCFRFASTLLATSMLASLPVRATTDTFSPTGSLSVARSNHTATLLSDGRVLVTGGFDYSNLDPLSSAEIYNPDSGSWSGAAAMEYTRKYHTATLLPNGQVLVVGGVADSDYTDLNSAELYDPVSDSWSPTGDLATARDSHTATLLPNGKVLVAGGYGASGPLDSAELYDPAQGTWTSAGNLATARYSHTATLLTNGMVIVAGGNSSSIGNVILNSAEIYDPSSNSWTLAAPMGSARFLHSATLLSNGKVLMVGGQDLASAEVYDPNANSWSPASTMNVSRWSHTANLLSNNQVLVAGGTGPNGITDSAELYDPSSDTWIQTGSLAHERYSHTATVLSNNYVLVAGGIGTGNSPLTSAELYDSLTSLESWRLEEFGSSANSGDGADLYDYYNDGIVNLMKYAFGLNPKQNCAGQIPQGQQIGNNYAITFTQPATVSGITYGAEWSETLLPGSWAAVPDTGTGLQHVFSVPCANHPKLFLRLYVSDP